MESFVKSRVPRVGALLERRKAEKRERKNPSNTYGKTLILASGGTRQDPSWRVLGAYLGLLGVCGSGRLEFWVRVPPSGGLPGLLWVAAWPVLGGLVGRPGALSNHLVDPKRSLTPSWGVLWGLLRRLGKVLGASRAVLE